jgi:hypothetical protein
VIAGAAAAVIVVACARAPQTSGSMPAPRQADTTGAPPQAMPGGDAHARIEQLANDIAERSRKDALPAIAAHTNPPEGDCKPTCMIEQMSVVPHAQDAACHPAHTQACDDACTLSDSICDDATQICDLAKQLATDAWAAGKCSDAQASCTAAHDRCCGCQ